MHGQWQSGHIASKYLIGQRNAAQRAGRQFDAAGADSGRSQALPKRSVCWLRCVRVGLLRRRFLAMAQLASVTVHACISGHVLRTTRARPSTNL